MTKTAGSANRRLAHLPFRPFQPESPSTVSGPWDRDVGPTISDADGDEVLPDGDLGAALTKSPGREHALGALQWPAPV